MFNLGDFGVLAWESCESLILKTWEPFSLELEILGHFIVLNFKEWALNFGNLIALNFEDFGIIDFEYLSVYDINDLRVCKVTLKVFDDLKVSNIV